MNNDEFLDKLGLKDPVHRRLVIENLPCGETMAEEAWRDKTLVQINAPRALIVCNWKGMVRGFQMAEKERHHA